MIKVLVGVGCEEAAGAGPGPMAATRLLAAAEMAAGDVHASLERQEKDDGGLCVLHCSSRGGKLALWLTRPVPMG